MRCILLCCCIVHSLAFVAELGTEKAKNTKFASTHAPYKSTLPKPVSLQILQVSTPPLVRPLLVSTASMALLFTQHPTPNTYQSLKKFTPPPPPSSFLPSPSLSCFGVPSCCCKIAFSTLCDAVDPELWAERAARSEPNQLVRACGDEFAKGPCVSVTGPTACSCASCSNNLLAGNG